MFSNPIKNRELHYLCKYHHVLFVFSPIIYVFCVHLTSALIIEGAVYTWGQGLYGQLGHGDKQGRAVPTELEVLGDVVSAAAGGDEDNAGHGYSFACTRTGAVFSWGGGELGPLGHGDKADRTVPTQLGLLGERHKPNCDDSKTAIFVRCLCPTGPAICPHIQGF